MLGFYVLRFLMCMARLRLSTLLVVINVGLLLLAVAGVAVTAVSLLGRLADEQALARVTQAGITAQQAVSRAGDSALTSARLLSERPTLARLLSIRDTTNLSPFLEQFGRTSKLDSCAVLLGDQVVAHSGADLPWEQIVASAQPEAQFLYSQGADQPLVLGAWEHVPNQSNGRVVVAVLLDENFTRRLGDEAGLPITIVDRKAVSPNSGDLRSQAISAAAPASGRRADLGLYQAALPLRTPSGEVVGALEASLPTTSVARSLQGLTATLLVLAMALAALAALVSLLVGRRLGAPLRSLTAASARIGRGDLDTPVPLASGAEIGTLAAALEEMRARLLRLTADLRRQQAEAQAIVTGIVEGVFTVDGERRIRYLNPQAAALLGIGDDLAVGRFCGDVLRPQGPGGVRPCEEHCPIVHARFRGGARATEHLLLGDGRRRTVVITSAPAVDGPQVQVLRDETEVEAARRLRDAILSNISHEFKTPLSAQLASIELLLDQLPDLATEQIGQLVLALQRGTVRLTQLIDNLLESARIEAGHDALRAQRVALDEVIEDALELTRPLLDQREQAIEVELPYPLPAIPGDALRLSQVFVNLLANANKFAPAGSTIRVGGEVGDAVVTLWVEDQGPGLPPDAGPALFGRFVRAPVEDPRQSGVGLGLWIVKSIVERHRGRVDARSNRAGLRMCVTLPREESDEDTGR
jgi:signal transduction histidine kinase